MEVIKWALMLSGLSLVFYTGVFYGENRTAREYQEQLLNQSRAYEARISREVKTAENLSQKYLDQSHELDRLYAVNLEFADRLQQQQRTESSSGANKPTACPVARSTPCQIPGKVLQDLARLARDADHAAAYAGTCREWIKEVKKPVK